MKVIVASSIISSALAGFTEISGYLNEFVTANSDTKNFLMIDIALANGYGCYCYPFDITGKGRGEPKDELDSFCKQLNDAYDCIATEEPDCNPSTVPYNVGGNAIIQSGWYDQCAW